MKEPNPYAPPVSDPGALPQTHGQDLYQAYRGRARTIRVVSVLLLLFSLFSLAAGLRLVNEGLDSWRESNGDLRVYQHPDLVAAGHREHALLALGFALPCLLLFIINSASTVGLWRFQELAAPGRTRAGLHRLGSRFAVRVLLLLSLPRRHRRRPDGHSRGDPGPAVGLHPVPEERCGLLAGLSRRPRRDARHEASIIARTSRILEFHHAHR